MQWNKKQNLLNQGNLRIKGKIIEFFRWVRNMNVKLERPEYDSDHGRDEFTWDSQPRVNKSR